MRTKRLTDRQALNFIANCSVLQGKIIRDDQFVLMNGTRTGALSALKKAVEIAMRAEDRNHS